MSKEGGEGDVLASLGGWLAAQVALLVQDGRVASATQDACVAMCRRAPVRGQLPDDLEEKICQCTPQQYLAYWLLPVTLLHYVRIHAGGDLLTDYYTLAGVPARRRTSALLWRDKGACFAGFSRLVRRSILHGPHTLVAWLRQVQRRPGPAGADDRHQRTDGQRALTASCLPCVRKLALLSTGHDVLLPAPAPQLPSLHTLIRLQLVARMFLSARGDLYTRGKTAVPRVGNKRSRDSESVVATATDAPAVSGAVDNISATSTTTTTTTNNNNNDAVDLTNTQTHRNAGGQSAQRTSHVESKSAQRTFRLASPLHNLCHQLPRLPPAQLRLRRGQDLLARARVPSGHARQILAVAKALETFAWMVMVRRAEQTPPTRKPTRDEPMSSGCAVVCVDGVPTRTEVLSSLCLLFHRVLPQSVLALFRLFERKPPAVLSARARPVASVRFDTTKTAPAPAPTPTRPVLGRADVGAVGEVKSSTAGGLGAFLRTQRASDQQRTLAAQLGKGKSGGGASGRRRRRRRSAGSVAVRVLNRSRTSSSSQSVLSYVKGQQDSAATEGAGLLSCTLTSQDPTATQASQDEEVVCTQTPILTGMEGSQTDLESLVNPFTL